MSLKSGLKRLAKSLAEIAYVFRDTLDVIDDHEARIRRLEEKLGFLADVELRVVEKAVAGGRGE